MTGIWVRYIDVKKTRYIQVVTGVKTPAGKASIKVLKSFGAYSLERKFRAQIYIAAYNSLSYQVEFVQKHSQGELGDLHMAALTVYGQVLGVKMVESIIHANEFLPTGDEAEPDIVSSATGASETVGPASED